MKKWINPELKNLSVGYTKQIGCEYVTSIYNQPPGGLNNPKFEKCEHYKGGLCYHPTYGVGNDKWPCPQGINIS